MMPAAGFPRLPGQPDDPLHTGVNVSLLKFAFLHGLFYCLIKHSAAAGHFEVTACLERLNPVIHCAPVCDNQPLKSPLFPKNIGQKFLIITGKNPINLIVRTHHGIRPALFHRHLESGQVDFSQRPLIHHAVPHHTILFLVVRRIVL